MIEVNSISFTLKKPNIHIIHPAPNSKTVKNINKTGCGLSAEESTASTKRMPSGTAKSFLFATLRINDCLCGIGNLVDQVEQFRVSG
jgi:hypothetical protein